MKNSRVSLRNLFGVAEKISRVPVPSCPFPPHPLAVWACYDRQCTGVPSVPLHPGNAVTMAVPVPRWHNRTIPLKVPESPGEHKPEKHHPRTPKQIRLPAQAGQKSTAASHAGRTNAHNTHRAKHRVGMPRNRKTTATPPGTNAPTNTTALTDRRTGRQYTHHPPERTAGKQTKGRKERH